MRRLVEEEPVLIGAAVGAAAGWLLVHAGQPSHLVVVLVPLVAGVYARRRTVATARHEAQMEALAAHLGQPGRQKQARDLTHRDWTEAPWR